MTLKMDITPNGETFQIKKITSQLFFDEVSFYEISKPYLKFEKVFEISSFL